MPLSCNLMSLRLPVPHPLSVAEDPPGLLPQRGSFTRHGGPLKEALTWRSVQGTVVAKAGGTSHLVSSPQCSPERSMVRVGPRAESCCGFTSLQIKPPPPPPMGFPPVVQAGAESSASSAAPVNRYSRKAGEHSAKRKGLGRRKRLRTRQVTDPLLTSE